MKEPTGIRRPPAFYTFRNQWNVSTSTARAFAVLNDIENYPQWWPEVRRVYGISDVRAEVRVRSLFPYVLNIVLEKEVADVEAGLLRTSISGDLVGWSSWTITANGLGSRLLFQQEVEVKKQLVRVLSPVARPVFRFNHTIMMRRGERGFKRYLQ
jgi:hypothetical protein